jgi:hypothetical protein
MENTTEMIQLPGFPSRQAIYNILELYGGVLSASENNSNWCSDKWRLLSNLIFQVSQVGKMG